MLQEFEEIFLENCLKIFIRFRGMSHFGWEVDFKAKSRRFESILQHQGPMLRKLTSTLAYSNTELIKTVKSFTLLSPRPNVVNKIWNIIY